MNIVDPKIEKYLSALLPERDAVLQEMEKMAAVQEFPIIGPLVGRLCYQLAKSIHAVRILELGSGFGYSAYWLAKALPEKGKIICTELSAENLKMAKDFFKSGGLIDKADFYEGDALEIIQQLEGQFDLIMNDVDKERYPESLCHIVARIRTGGLLITDNMLWHGRILDSNPDHQSQAILQYTKNLYEARDLWTTIIPLRDGVGISLKR